jgi:hypothetical protein
MTDDFLTELQKQIRKSKIPSKKYLVDAAILLVGYNVLSPNGTKNSYQM